MTHLGGGQLNSQALAHFSAENSLLGTRLQIRKAKKMLKLTIQTLAKARADVENPLNFFMC